MNKMLVGCLSIGAMAALVALSSSAALPDGVIYRNDFTTRESLAAIPQLDRWYEAQPYKDNGKNANLENWLCNRTDLYSSFLDAYRKPAGASSVYYDVGMSVDGWAVPDFNNWWKLSTFVRYDTGNACFYYGYGNNSSTCRFGQLIQPFYNELSNGVLRISVDLRKPAVWEKGSGGEWFSVMPVFKSQLDLMSMQGEDTTECSFPDFAGRFGIRAYSDEPTQKTKFVYFNAYKAGATKPSSGWVDVKEFGDRGKCVWYRFVVDYDIDGETFGGTVYKMGETQPTLQTAVGEVETSFADKPFYKNGANGGKEPFAGIDFWAWMVPYSTSSSTNKVFADNIALSWKRPGSETFETFYENDFQTRRYRILAAPNVATTGSYPQEAKGEETVTYSGYPYEMSGSAAKRNWEYGSIVPSDFIGGATAVQPAGYDGWRSLYLDATHPGFAPVANYCFNSETNDTLMLSRGSVHAVLAQSIGRTVSTGKVRLQAAFRTPNLSYEYFEKNPEYARLFLWLGNEALYVSPKAAIDGNIGAGVGIQYVAGAGATNRVAYCLTTAAGGGDADGRAIDLAVNLDLNAWYRFELTADLDTQTYDCSIAPLGTSQIVPTSEPSGAAVFARTGVPFKNALSDLGSFVVSGFGNGSSGTLLSSTLRYTFIDDIKVWVAEGGAEEKLVYANDFTTSTRVLPARNAGVLATMFDRDDGPDHWVRPNTLFGAAALRGGSDAWVSMETVGDDVTAYVQETGDLPTNDKFTFSVDMRPPSGFAKDGFAAVSLGDGRLAQAVRARTAADFASCQVVKFGYCDAGPMTEKTVMEKAGFFLRGLDGNGKATNFVQEVSTTGHWHRFVAKVDPVRKTCLLKVYDMGTAHPTSATQRGNLLCAFDEVLLALEPQGALSAVCLSAAGGLVSADDITGSAEVPKVDNLEIKPVGGLILIVQ